MIYFLVVYIYYFQTVFNDLTRLAAINISICKHRILMRRFIGKMELSGSQPFYVGKHIFEEIIKIR